MKKRNLFNILVLLYALFFVVSCSLNTKKDGKGESDNSGHKIIETGDLSAIDTRSFVLPRFGNYWYQMKIIGILKHGSIYCFLYRLCNTIWYSVRPVAVLQFLLKIYFSYNCYLLIPFFIYIPIFRRTDLYISRPYIPIEVH